MDVDPVKDGNELLVQENLMERLTEVFQGAIKAMQEEEEIVAIPPIMFPSIALSLSVYCYSIKQVEPDEDALEILLEEIKGTRDRAKARLFGLNSTREEMPVDWEPISLLDSNKAYMEANEVVDNYFILSVQDQLRLSRLTAYCAMGFHRKFNDFPTYAKLLSSGILRASYAAWDGLVDSYKDNSINVLLAYYYHLQGFANSPSFHLELSDIPATYPRPASANASRAPLAFLFALDSYHFVRKTALQGENLELALEPLCDALIVICRDHPNMSISNIVQAASDSNNTLKKATANLQQYEVSENVKNLFESLCNVSKCAHSERKKRHYMEWEEHDMIFRFGWAWKVQPRLQTGKIKNPHGVFASVLVDWSRNLKPECRWEVSIEIYKVMQRMCEAAPDPKTRKASLAAQCLPEFNFLLPSVSSLPSHITYLLMLPELVENSSIINRRNTGVDASPSTSKPSQNGTSRGKRKTETVDSRVALVLAHLAKVTGTPSLNESYAKYMDHEYDKIAHRANLQIPVVPAISTTGPTPLGRLPHKITPNANATEHALWSKFKNRANQNNKFKYMIGKLSEVYAAHPEAIAFSIDLILVLTKDTPSLLLFLRCAYTWLRVSS